MFLFRMHASWVAAVLLLLCVAVVSGQSAAKRAVSAKGVLLCGKKPAENVRIRLFRTPQKKTDDLDQILDERTTTNSGMFQVEGNTNGFPLNETGITPTLTIYHNCDEDPKKAKKNGYRKFNYNVPAEYVNLGAKAKKAYDVGTINLELEYPGEKHDKKFVERPAK